MSMDASGKIIWAKHAEIQQANIKSLSDQDVKDGERLALNVKDMGSCEVYPQTIAHNPNGRSIFQRAFSVKLALITLIALYTNSIVHFVYGNLRTESFSYN